MMSMARRFLKGLLWYSLGFATVWLIAGLTVFGALRGWWPPSLATALVMKWRICEGEGAPGVLAMLAPERKGKNLFILSPESGGKKQGDEWQVEISCGDDAKVLKFVEFRTLESSGGDLGLVFEYKAKGKYGVPEAQYSGGAPLKMQTMAWQDFNADGRFDLRCDFAKKLTEILVSGEWVPAKMVDSIAETDDGRKFAFDLKTGQWQPVAPTADK